MTEKAVGEMSLDDLKRAYIRAQKKLWGYQVKIANSRYNTGYDPYGYIKSWTSSLNWWKRRATNTLYELERRGAWMATNRDYNQTNMH
jgi:hypothetical protein